MNMYIQIIAALSETANIAIGATTFAIVIGVIIFFQIKKRLCPKCWKKNTYEMTDKTEIKRTKISRPLNKNGSKIYGERVTYKLTYKCRNCGNEITKTEYHDQY